MVSRETNTTGASTPTSENTFKIFVATDNHLGYKEKNPIRGQDSFITFEEILQIASTHEVDFILLGGDLFHDSQPSSYCVHKCLELLRLYCLSDRPVHIEFLSDQSRNFQFSRTPVINYEDPNLNVGIPVFSIHGNHDDPIGHKQISALDILASTGFLNYFGRTTNFKQVEVRPILLQKGTSKLALYGLSHIKDERLARLFLEKNVVFKKPEGDDWFHLLVLHQNRAARGVKNFIPETAIPQFMDLVIWGHEHDCRIEPEATSHNVYISQPGSSVATSLAQGENIPKKAGLLQIHHKEFKMVGIPLKTVRPFLIDELVLHDPASKNYNNRQHAEEQAIQQVEEKIEEMIAAALEPTRDSGNPAPLPLIRLKVFYHNERQHFNAIRFGMHFGQRVANPEDMVILKDLLVRQRSARVAHAVFNPEDEAEFENTVEWAESTEAIVKKYFDMADEKSKLTILSVPGILQAVSQVVQTANSEAIPLMIGTQTKKTIAYIKQLNPDIENIDETIKNLKLQRNNEVEIEANANGHNENNVVVGNDETVMPVVKEEHVNDDAINILSSDDEDLTMPSVSSRPAKGRGSRGVRGSRARGARASARSTSTASTSSSSASRGRGSRKRKTEDAIDCFELFESNF